jgi:hypothetical protein
MRPCGASKRRRPRRARESAFHTTETAKSVRSGRNLLRPTRPELTQAKRSGLFHQVRQFPRVTLPGSGTSARLLLQGYVPSSGVEESASVSLARPKSRIFARSTLVTKPLASYIRSKIFNDANQKRLLEQQKLGDLVILAQPRTLVVAGAVFRSGREAGGSRAFPRFVTPTCRPLQLIASACFYSCFVVNRCDKGFQ